METPEGISDRNILKRGLPQEGVLSALVFNIALISLSKTVEKDVKISMCADDICTWLSGHNRKAICSRLEGSINNIVRCLHILSLAFFPGKCLAMRSIDVGFLIQLKKTIS